jgi:hypothetical protein
MVGIGVASEGIGQGLADAAVAAFHLAMDLGMAGLDEAVLDHVGDTGLC